jgi:hypothetical protein
MHPRPIVITAMPLRPIIACGITWADMKFLKVRPIPTLLKLAMPSCVTTWLVWREDPVASRVALMLLSVHFACLFIVSTVGNFISNSSRTILAMFWITLAHYFSHSQSIHRNLDDLFIPSLR